MHIHRHFPKALLISATLLIGACDQQNRVEQAPAQQNPLESAVTRGVYGDPGTLLEAGYRFDELGMNAIFVRSISLDDEIYKAAKSQNTRIFVEFPTLLGRYYVEEHPDAWPIDQTGKKSPPADWFMGVCPTNPGFKAHREQQLRNILANYEVDGIFLDYVHWHAQFETTDPILPETCFCEHCISSFSKHIGITVPEGNTAEQASWILTNTDPEWRAWRNHVLNQWVSDLGAVVEEVQPDALLGVFHCAWYPDDHNAALYRTLGIDMKGLASNADVLAPMLFHQMKARPTKWVSEYTAWLGELIKQSDIGPGPKIWPIVQAHNTPGVVSPEEFRQVMIEGAKPPSSGIMMFSDRSLLEDKEKLEVMRSLYLNDRTTNDSAANDSQL